jgi:uncharacterized SAM-binding protein YcdF (DUF218 family)
MFFYVAKVVWFFLQPSSLVLLALAGAWWFGRRERSLEGASRVARWLTGLGLALCLAGLSPVPNWLIFPLEQRFERADLGGMPIAGIVILGGGEEAPIGFARHTHALNEAGERISEAVALARKLPQARIVFSGGSAALLPGAATEAGVVRAMFTEMGVAPERITFEDRSRDTWENASFTKAMIEPKLGERWLLVTSAWHMPRAMGVFRAAGFMVEAWPVDYRTAGWRDWLTFFQSPADGLRRLDLVAKEYSGLLAYWLKGRTRSLFPGPECLRGICR